MAINLQKQINDLNHRYTEADGTLRQDLAAAEAKRESLRQEQERLRTELVQIDDELQRKREELEDLPQRFRKQTVGSLVVRALMESQQEIYDRLKARRQHERKFKLVLVMIVNERDAEITWVLPLPPEKKDYPVEIADLLDEFVEQCFYVILRLGQHIDWYYAGMADEITPWQRFASVATLLEYSGKEAMAVHAEKTLQEQFNLLLTSRQSGPLQGWQIAVEVAAIEQDSQERIIEPEIIAEPEKEREREEPVIPLFVRSAGWYKDEDIIAWERPLPLTADSNWSLQARRLRAALIGLLARGYMGSDYLEQQTLWQPLPSPHQQAMKEGIERLCENGILMMSKKPNGNDETLVSVNPEMINRVQDLINRQVDDMWQRITSS